MHLLRVLCTNCFVFCLSLETLAFFTQSKNHEEWISVNPDTHLLIDKLGRTRIFHGVNVVYKIPPWHPPHDAFDADYSLCEQDAQNLRRWGFNIVRLGVMWPGVEPIQGWYNETYLEQIDQIITMLAKYEIYTIVDFHQDLLGRRYCGEGVPQWAEDLLVSGYAEKDVRPFPWPVADNLEYNEEGYPEYQSCQSTNFLFYYFSQEVSAAFQAFFDNKNGVLDSFTDFWRHLANRYKDNSWVIGYEIMNEPWAGDYFSDPRKLLQFGFSEAVNLEPMHRQVGDAIREIDSKHLLFYGGNTWDYWPVGFNETVGGRKYEDRDVMSYHIYCFLSGTWFSKTCNFLNRLYFEMRTKDVNRLGGGSMLTEFGAVPDSKLPEIQAVMDMADELFTSWAYWSFKDYHDVTTIHGGSQAMYNNGTLSIPKLSALTRSYAQVIAGEPENMRYDSKTHSLHLSFTPTACVDSGNNDTDNRFSILDEMVLEDSRTSMIYLHTELHYRHGYNVKIEPASSVYIGIPCGGNELKLVNSCSNNGKVTVLITPCRPNSHCLCSIGGMNDYGSMQRGQDTGQQPKQAFLNGFFGQLFQSEV